MLVYINYSHEGVFNGKPFQIAITYKPFGLLLPLLESFSLPELVTLYLLFPLSLLTALSPSCSGQFPQVCSPMYGLVLVAILPPCPHDALHLAPPAWLLEGPG